MGRNQKILVHILFWGIIMLPLFATPAYIIYSKGDELKKMMPDFPVDFHDAAIGMTSGFLSFLFTFYLVYLIIHPLILRKNVPLLKKVLLLVSFLLIIQMFKWTAEYLYENLANQKSISSIVNRITARSNFKMLIGTFFQGGIAIGFKTILNYFDEKKKRKELETSNLKNELGMLRSQVNPHFLFNTLNNIDTLIKKEPDKASELIIRLSDEMRYMLYDANIESIEIKQELKFLDNYISLQKVRINHANPVLQKIEIDNPHKKIPPMLFLPLIENAFKHGRFKSVNDSIELSIYLKNNILEFNITNPYDETSSMSGKQSGLGLGLVKKRFELIFPGKHLFENINENGNFTIYFRIELNEN